MNEMNATTPKHEAHKGMIVKLAKRYSRKDDFEDLMAEGMIGLLEAEGTYDATKGAFSTHAFYQIRRRMAEYARAFARAGTAFSGKEGRVAYGSNRSTVPHDLRLDAVVNSDMDQEGKDLLVDSAPMALDVLSANAPLMALRSFGDSIRDPRDRAIWANFLMEEPLTMAELGKVLGCTKQRISQLATKLRARAQKALLKV